MQLTDDMRVAICEFIAGGGNLDTLCTREDFPSRSTVYKWLTEFPEFSNDYERARAKRADSRSDRIDAYTRDMLSKIITPEQCRVAIDAEKWQAGKENGRRYGDSSRHEHTGADGQPIAYRVLTESDNEIIARHLKNK